MPPQILVGIGLSLVLSALTETAVSGRVAAGDPRWLDDRRPPRRSGRRPADPDPDLHRPARTAAGRRARRRHRRSLLDSSIPPAEKLDLGTRLADQVDLQGDRVPDVAPAFEPLPTDPVERDEYEDVLAQIEDQLDRAATHAFSSSFFIAALFGLIALLPIGLTRRLDL